MQLTLIQKKIFEVREQKIMLDFDLAELYGVETKRVKEAVRRNIGRFPPDFMFELSQNEWVSLRSQIASLKTGRGKHPKYPPFAFTEHGVAKLSGVLKSEKAIQMNIAIIKTFMVIREFAMNYQALKRKLLSRKKNLTGKPPTSMKSLNTSFTLRKRQRKNGRQLGSGNKNRKNFYITVR
jgi:hypothetical protein